MKKLSQKSVGEARISSLRRGTRAGTIGAFFLREGDLIVEDSEALTMSPAESAFLARDIRERLSQFVNGMLPPAPALFPKPGAAMFVDISDLPRLEKNCGKPPRTQNKQPNAWHDRSHMS